MERSTEKQDQTRSSLTKVQGLILCIIVGIALPAVLFFVLQAVLKMNNVSLPRWYVPECVFVGIVFFYSLVSLYIGFPYRLRLPQKKISEVDPEEQTEKLISTVEPQFDPRFNKYFAYINGERIYFDHEPDRAELEEQIRLHRISEKYAEKGRHDRVGKVMMVLCAIIALSWSSVILTYSYIDTKVIEHTFVPAVGTVTEVTSMIINVPGERGRSYSENVYKIKYEYEYDHQQNYGVYKSGESREKGTQLKVYINPSDPSEKYATAEFKGSLIHFIIGTITMIGFFKIIIIAFLS